MKEIPDELYEKLLQFCEDVENCSDKDSGIFHDSQLILEELLSL
jgi:hypothetical protein